MVNYGDRDAIDGRALSELAGLAVVTFLVSGAPTTLLQYFDAMPNSDVAILAPTLLIPVPVAGLYLYLGVETDGVFGYGVRLWFLLAMVNVGMMGVFYAAIVALFGLS